MTMRLLDTDIMIDVLRSYPPAIEWLSSVGNESIALPGFVVMELIQGCSGKSEQNRLLISIADLEIMWPEAETRKRALETFAEYRLGHGIGIIDTLIGQMAADEGIPLHTFNIRHYRIIPGLEIISPYEK